MAQWQDGNLPTRRRDQAWVQDEERSEIFFLLSLIVYIIQAPTEAMFQNLMSVLKIYSAHNEN